MRQKWYLGYLLEFISNNSLKCNKTYHLSTKLYSPFFVHACYGLKLMFIKIVKTR